ncbi:MAG: hypothetical protein GX602_00210 [Dehalococcoidales bacterium]|nr:hypothetical protein [Dehalococcoidales bacterium]
MNLDNPDMEEDIESLLANQCTVNESWFVSGNFSSFYLIRSTYSPQANITPGKPITERCGEDGKTTFQYDGREWIISESKVVWRQSKKIESIPGVVEWDHWHTNFLVNSHTVHIDFVSFLRMGPRTAYREYRVFCDQNEVSRGGGFAGFLGGNFKFFRNWPLTVEVDNYLIHIRDLLQPCYDAPVKGEIKEINPILFIRDNNSEK